MLADNEETYRYFTVEVFSQNSTREWYFQQLISRDASKIQKRFIWLSLMGLMETSDTPGQ